MATSPTTSDLANVIRDLARPLSTTERVNAEANRTRELVERSGGFSAELKYVVETYDRSIGALLTTLPGEATKLIRAYYLENPAAIRDALEDDDLKQIADHLLDDEKLSAIVRRAASAYLSADLVRAYNAALDAFRARSRYYDPIAESNDKGYEP